MYLKKYHLPIIFILLLQFNCSNESIRKLDWLFIYLMPYDNNLSNLGDEIIEMTRRGTSDKIGSVFCVDKAGEGGIQFYSVLDKQIELRKEIDSDEFNSNSINEYLLWIQENLMFDRYVIVFLDHGGKLDQICLDEYPENEYLNISDLSNVIERFNKGIKKKAELLFLQVCAKGSIEALYEFRECANYTMYSQTVLGAPNYYYEKTLSEIGVESNISGGEIAKKIADSDLPRMYNSYSCIKNNNLDSLVNELKDLIIFLNDKNIKIIGEGLTSYSYLNEEYWDLASLLLSLPIKKEKKDSLLELIYQEVVVLNRVNENSPYTNLNGLYLFSIYNEEIMDYQYLDFYQKTRILDLVIHQQK